MTELADFTYCPSLSVYKRLKTRVVNIGTVPLGGEYPIRIQSMTVSSTMDTQASVEEVIRIIKSGSDYVRLTAPSTREAANLKNIRDTLHKRGYKQPLIADIHFTPHAAEVAARIVEKVRINPGNYADRKKFKVIEYTDEDYNAELERIYARFSPLVKICKENGTAIRIGTNHGSLSDRILNRYGDTPLGMVESAMEFVHICEDHNFHDIVLSMKASNPVVMVEAYRLLVNRMYREGVIYPLHLGVTEAGEGEEGRIKSAMGIGTLLEDGLGDTIRVSLTEPPERESPVARRIVERYNTRKNSPKPETDMTSPLNPFVYSRRQTIHLENLGGKEVPRVIAEFPRKTPAYGDLTLLGYTYHPGTDTWDISKFSVDFIYAGSRRVPFNIPPELGVLYDYPFWCSLTEKHDSFPLIHSREVPHAAEWSERLNFIHMELCEYDTDMMKALPPRSVLILEGNSGSTMVQFREIIFRLMHLKKNIPVIIKRKYAGIENEDFMLYSAIDVGGLLLDGLGDGVWLEPSSERCIRTVFGILQASRTRVTTTEYISCPSCGRTLFDLEETSAKIRRKTNHLKGLKIGIMGCIVNGPGEMADADYGYVGTGAGKISLYRGKELVKRNIPAESAVDALISLIREDGNWHEP